MIEQAMIFALGFLTAGLLALAAAPAFWRRAERLSMRRLEMTMPLSPREVVAERDALRADFAVEARRMERVCENAAARLAAVQADLGREIASGFDVQTALSALQGRHAEQGAELARATRERHVAEAGQAATEKALHDADAMAADRAHRLAEREHTLAETERLAEERRASISAGEARMADLIAHIESVERTLATRAGELAARDRTLAETERLAEERRASISAGDARMADLAAHIESVERTLATRADELTARDRTLAETAHLAEERRASLSVAEARNDGLAAELETAARTIETHARDLAARDRTLAETEHLSEERRASLSSAEGRIDGLGARLESAERTIRTLDHELAELAELKATHSALRLKADASAHALADVRPELERLRRISDARGAADLADIADLDDPQLRVAIHDLGATIARLAGRGTEAHAADQAPAVAEPPRRVNSRRRAPTKKSGGRTKI